VAERLGFADMLERPASLADREQVAIGKLLEVVRVTEAARDRWV